MYILENAFHNVIRNKGRNILIGVMIFAVIVTTVITLMINSTASRIIDDYKGRFSSEVLIQPNVDKVREEAMNNSTDGLVKMTVPSLSADQYIAYGESEYLAGSVYTAAAGVICNDITSIDSEKGGGSGMMMTGMGGDLIGMDENTPMEFMLSLKGNMLSDFESGSRELSDGKMPEELNECMVSTELADLNSIQIGDTLDFTGELRNTKEGTVQQTSYTLTVVGTYYDLTEEYGDDLMQQNAYTNRRNEILTTYDTVAQEFISDMNGIRIGATFYLKEPNLLDEFEQELREKGLPDVFDVSTDSASYEKIVGPVEGLKGIAVTFMLVVIIFGGIIIGLLASIAIRERKYEIGVLRAMGMKKSKVALGLWTEMLIVTLICLTIGIGVGRLAAQPVTNTLLDTQIKAAEKADEESMYNGRGGMTRFPGQTNSTNAEPLKEIDISLGFDTILEITGIGLLLASFAGLISVSRITKYEPIRILMERN